MSVWLQGLSMGEDSRAICVGQSSVITIDEHSDVKWIIYRQVQVILVDVNDL